MKTAGSSGLKELRLTGKLILIGVNNTINNPHIYSVEFLIHSHFSSLSKIYFLCLCFQFFMDHVVKIVLLDKFSYFVKYFFLVKKACSSEIKKTLDNWEIDFNEANKSLQIYIQ